MASSIHFLLTTFLTFSSLAFISSSSSQPASNPNKLVLIVHKDGATGLHVATLYKRTLQYQARCVVDLNGKFSWLNCENQNYLSSTFHAPQCHSTQCSRANTNYCMACPSKMRSGTCHNNTCGLKTSNPVTQQAAIGPLAQDTLAIYSTRGSNLGSLVRIPQFLFACAPSMLLQKGLPKYVQGIVGLGHAPIALQIQLSTHFGLKQTFSLCLSPSKGVIFFGNGPYYMQRHIDVSHSLAYTPLAISPQGEYYIKVTSIRINNKLVPNINPSLLSVTKRGLGGTMISTTIPYTILEHSIYNAVTQFFARELRGIPKKLPVSPFGLCFDSSKISSTRLGPGVPSIEFVMQDQNTRWIMSGANSMVRVRQGVSCLGFVDGGYRPINGAAIVIGAYQLEDNFLQFDLSRSMLGFSSSLLLRQTKCANFNFNSSSASP